MDISTTGWHFGVSMAQEIDWTQREFHRKNQLHVARKIWHFSGVMFIAVVFYLVSRPISIQLISSLTFFGVALDFVRQQNPKVNAHVVRILGPFMREHERNGLAGTTYLLLGVFTIILLFPKPIVLLTLLFLAIADPLASYVGILYGRDRIFGHKSLQGSLAAFFACVVVSGSYFAINGIMSERMFLASLCSGIVGSLSELVPVGRLDDNLTFPLICSVSLYGVFYFFGGL